MARRVVEQYGSERSAGRQAYSRPVLRVYGSVGRLTQAGTGLNSEFMANSMGMGNGSRNKRA